MFLHAVKSAPSTERLPRNPGPPFGYQLLRLGHRILPHRLFYPMVKAGTVIAVLRMGKERRASREYLAKVLEREPRFADILEHFYTQVHTVIDKVTLRNRQQSIPRPADDPHTRAFIELASSSEQALFGTFHVGNSDMIGAALSTFGRTVHMVRLRVRNSPDTETLKRVFGQGLEFVWANNPADVAFKIGRLLGEGHTLALQCDRVEYGSKLHPFYFLGAERLFPVTIYHLSHMFQVPVGFALSVPAADGSPAVVSSGVFRPDPEDRHKTLERGYAHFQRTLDLLEAQLKRTPYIWFNFLPLNPVSDEPQQGKSRTDAARTDINRADARRTDAAGTSVSGADNSATGAARTGASHTDSF